MRIIYSVFLSALLLFSVNAFASVESDINEGKSLQEIFDNAQDASLTLTEIFAQIQAADQSLLANAAEFAINTGLSTPGSILAIAFSVIPEAQKADGSEGSIVSLISEIAQRNGLPANEVVNIAVASGVDLTAALAGTAAGPGAAGPGTAGGGVVAGSGAPLNTAGFGSGAGGAPPAAVSPN